VARRASGGRLHGQNVRRRCAERRAARGRRRGRRPSPARRGGGGGSVPLRAAHLKRDIALEAIIDYKLLKAAGEGAVGVVLLVLLMRGAEAGAATLAQFVIDHTSRAWALQAATAIVVTGTTAHLKVATAGAFADALLSAVEGLALRAGRWWAPWLVVIATAALLPWELVEIFVHPRWGRFVILGINLTVVAYLLWEVWRGRTVRMPTTASVDRSAPGP